MELPINKSEKMKNDVSWQSFINSFVNYSALRNENEPFSEVIEKGLEIFSQFPFARKVSLFLIDSETYLFSFSRSLPASSHQAMNDLFSQLTDEGYVSIAIDSGGMVLSEVSEIADKKYILIPLLNSGGVVGIVVIDTDDSRIEIEQLMLGLIQIFALHFAAQIGNAQLIKDFKSVQSILEQKISVRTGMIKKRHRELETIIDSILTGVLLIEPGTEKIINANFAALELLLEDKEKIVGKFRSEYFSDQLIYELNTNDILSARIGMESEIKRNDGTVIPIYKAIIPVILSEKKYLLESFIDITKRKLAEDALRESERRFRTIFERAGIGMILTDLSGNISETNFEFCRMLGYSGNDLRFMNISEITHPDDASIKYPTASIENETFNSRRYMLKERKFVHRNGEIVWTKVTNTILQGFGEKPVYNLSMVENITLQKKNEEILYRQTNLLNGIADAANTLLTINDLKTALLMALESIGKSAEVERVYIFENHFDAEECELLTSQNYLWQKGENYNPNGYVSLKNISYKTKLKRWYKILSDDESISGFFNDFPENEHTFFEEMNIKSILLVPVKVHDDFKGFIGLDDCFRERRWTEAEESLIKTVATSIGSAMQRAIAQKELVVAKEKAEELSLLKSYLLANMSHEIRTPLTGILGFATFLKDELTDEYHRGIIEHVIFSGQRLLSTLQSILSLSELQSGNLEASLTRENLSLMVVESASKFQPMAVDSNLELYMKVFSEDVSIMVDKALFHQVLDNLIDNAIKYSEKGSVTVIAEEEIIGSVGYGVVKVVDTGIGIAPENYEKIFFEFRQVSEGYGRRFEGTGLGLTLTKKMVELMNGSIQVDSEVGVGSTFTVKIPAILISRPEPNKISSPQETAPIEIAETPKKKSIVPEVLLVEDNILNKKVVEIYLNKICRINYAKTGLSAVKMAEEKLYDVILMDIHLGKNINGIEAANMIRKIEGYDKVPVVALTGYTMSGDKEALLAQGFNYYLAKPFKESEIMSLMETIFLNSVAGYSKY